MKLTNRLSLPQPLVNAVERDSYDRGLSDYTVTELIQPARARALIKRHWEEISEDVADRIWALCGQIGHLILERSAVEDYVERRFFATIAGKRISGRCDLITTGDRARLVDYKFTSLWSIREGAKPEWEAQCNMLVWLAARNDVIVESAQIVAILRDWSRPRALREPDYPQAGVAVIDVPLWGDARTEAYICDRIRAHEEAQIWLPECTDEERWKTPDRWRVIAPGHKRAARLCDSESEAHAWAQSRGGNFRIEHVPGEAKRCETYCLAYAFCDQAQKEKSSHERVHAEVS